MEEAEKAFSQPSILSVLADAIVTALSRIPQSFSLGNDEYVAEESRYFRGQITEDQKKLKKALGEAKGSLMSSSESKTMKPK